MSINLHYNPSTGNIGFTENNNLQAIVIPSGPGIPCSFCGELETPKYIRVTLSGVEFIEDDTCINCSGLQGDAHWDTGFNPNGSYILTQSTSCAWNLNIPVSIVYNRWRSTDGSCTTTNPETIEWTSLLLQVFLEPGGTVGVLLGGSLPNRVISLFGASGLVRDIDTYIDTNGDGGSGGEFGCAFVPGLTAFYTIGRDGSVAVEGL